MPVPSDSPATSFEQIRRQEPDGPEYWLARDLQPLLGYDVWSNFEAAIGRAKDACHTSGQPVDDHFLDAERMVMIGSGATRASRDFYLSRYACYLVAMNGDPKKPEIAAAQTYFAIQARRMEVQDQSLADEKRLELRAKVSQSFKRVSGAAHEAGVRGAMQGVFHDARYRGLYGMSLRELGAHKGLKAGEQLFDRAGPLELSANDFQMNMAADVIANERIRGEQACIAKNKQLAQQVRRTMQQAGATMPEKLPLEAPIKDIKKKVSAQKKIASASDPSAT